MRIIHYYSKLFSGVLNRAPEALLEGVHGVLDALAGAVALLEGDPESGRLATLFPGLSNMSTL